MKREIVNFVQGSDAWHAHRDGSYNASESPSMLNINGAHTSRSELIRQVATGIRPEVDAHTQKRFDEGHRAEALARPLAEKIIGDDLFPSTMTLEVEGLKRKLSASLDGRTMDDATTWEHKLLNNALAASLSIGIIPEKYHPQMEQGLMITGAKRCLFMASAWDDYENLIEEKHVWYESNPELRAKLIPGWKQFELDVESYQHVEVEPAPVAAPIRDLPVLYVRAKGEVTDCNMAAYKAGVAEFLATLDYKPTTDQGLVDAKAIAAKLRAGAKAIKAKKAEMLEQTLTIGEVCKDIDLMAKQMDAAALTLEKAFEAEHDRRKLRLIDSGRDALAAHVKHLNKRIGKDLMPAVSENFALVIKGLSKMESLQNAIDSELAKRKIEANEIADRIEINIKSLTGEGHDWTFLFPDLKAVCWSSVEDFSNRLTVRIASHNEAEDKRRAAERERIRQEEAARIEREQAEAAAKAVSPAVEAIVGEMNAIANIPLPVAPPRSEDEQMMDEIIAAIREMNGSELKLMLHMVDRIMTGRKVAA